MYSHNPILDQLTIVITTYKRYHFLKRLLKFYEAYKLDFKILILDSSPEVPEDEELKELLSLDHMTWKRYDSSTLVAQKISEACKHIETEYVVICADDDFIIPTALKSSIDFLSENPDYASVQGLTFLHDKKNIGLPIEYFRINPIYDKGRSSKGETGTKRIQEYLDGQTSYYPFYAVHRASTFHTIWNESANYTTDWGLAELFPCCYSFACGKMKVLPVFYSSREKSVYSWSNILKTEINFSEEKLGLAVKGLGKHLSKVDGIPLEEAERVCRDAFDNYLDSYRKKLEKINSMNNSFFIKYLKMINHTLRIRTRVISLIYLLRYQGCHPSIYPKYLEDFKRVKEAVLSARLTADDTTQSRKDY